MFYYFLVLLAVIGLAVNFSLNKIYQNHVGSGSRMIVLFNIITAACTAVIFFFINGFMNGFSLSVTPFSLWMAALLALLCGSYSVIGFRIISMGNIAVYTLFLMLGGMMLPYFYGLIFLDEGFSVPRLLGLLLMVVSIVLSGLDGDKQADRGRKKASKLFFALCIVVFCLNGMTSITSKIHQLDANAHIAVNPQTFVMLTAVIRVVFFSLVYLVIRLRDGKRPPQDRPVPVKIKLPILGIMVAAAAVDGLSYLLQLIGASHLPATVLYPLVTGGTIVLTAVAGRLLFKQTLSRRAMLGLVLCFASTFLFL